MPAASSTLDRSALDPERRDDLRTALGRTRDDARLRWLVVLVGVGVLVSTVSGGLFLYAAIVVVLVAAGGWLVAELGVSDLEIERSLSSAEVELGGTVDVEVMLHNRKALPAPWLTWSDAVDERALDVEGARGDHRSLDAGHSAVVSYRLHPQRRGLFRVGPLVVESSDPLGLIERTRVDDRADFLTVLPRAVPMGRGWPLGHAPIHQTPRRRSLFEDPSRFRGIRAYRQGDGLRRIHWRATARTGELQVKVYEPAVLAGVLLAVDLEPRAPDADRDDAPDPLVELTITAAASIGRWVLGGDQVVGLLSNGADAADRFPVDWSGGSFRRLEGTEAFRPVELMPAKGDRQWRELRAALARLEPAHVSSRGPSQGPSRNPSLAELLHLELPRLPRSLVLAVITPRLDAELSSSIAALRRSGIEVAVVWIVGKQSPESDAGPAADEPRPSLLPASVPVDRVERAADLERLGDLRW